MSHAIEISSKLPDRGFFAGRSSRILIYFIAPAIVALIYAVGVGLSLTGNVVELDIIVFSVFAFILLSVAVFGRMLQFEAGFARSITPVGLLFALICLFAIPVLEAFRLRSTNGYFMFGFVPWSDAEAYVPGGWQMLVDATLNDWHQRRPINASMMELRLLLAGFNLHALVLLNSVMLALATFYAAIEIEKHVGALATAMFAVLMFGYAQPYLPSTLSEMLGLSLGIVAFGALLRSARLGAMWQFAIGLALLSFALNARAGNYFVLPAVWLWGVIYLGRNLRERALVGIVGGFALLSGFVYSLALIKIFGSGDLMTYNANFGDTLYGLAKGGIGWHRAQEDHPELYTIDAAQRAAALFKISLREIVSHPLRFVGVYFHDMGDAVPAMLGGPELHTIDGRQPPTILFRVFAVVNLIGLGGLLLCALDRRNALILLALVGFFVSVPFIWRDGGPRVLAGSMTFVLFVTILGTRMIGLFFQGSGFKAIRDCLAPLWERPSISNRQFLLVPTATFLVVALTPFVLGGRLKAMGANLPAMPIAGAEPLCPAGTRYLKFDRNRLMYTVRVHPGDETFIDSMGDMSFGQLQSTLAPFHISDLFHNLPAPYTIFAVMDGGRSGRNFLTVVWKDKLEHFATGNRWDMCIGEFPHEFTGYKGHVHTVEKLLPQVDPPASAK